MSERDPFSSLTDRLWAIAISFLGLVIIANLIWIFLIRIWPLLLIILVTGTAVWLWNRWRWR